MPKKKNSQPRTLLVPIPQKIRSAFAGLGLKSKAQFGASFPALDEHVERYLEAVNTGQIAIPELDDNCTEPLLLRLLSHYIRDGSHTGIRNIADAVERVHARIITREEGGKIRFKEADATLARTIEQIELSGTMPIAAKSLNAAVRDAGAEPMSLGNLRRIARKLGSKPGRRGPERKPKLASTAPKNKRLSDAELRREIAIGKKFFDAKRKRLTDEARTKRAR